LGGLASGEVKRVNVPKHEKTETVAEIIKNGKAMVQTVSSYNINEIRKLLL